MKDNLVDAVLRTLEDAGVAAGSRVCCALSGGVDSVVLVHLLHELAPHCGFRLQAAHVHHGLSAHADDWAHRCTELCARLQLPLTVFHVDVDRHDPRGLEAAARAARHAALERVDCDWLVFGHHQDDQAETVLFRLLRGSGVRGTGAMVAIGAERSPLPRHLRPLLDCRRADIHAWAMARQLSWVEDDSNVDTRHLRNDLRHRILPACSQRFPAAVPALARAAGHFREAAQLLDELAALDAARCGGTEFAREALLALSDARIANLLRWRLHGAGAAAPSQARLHEALRQLRSAAPMRPLRLDLGALACCVYRGRVWLESNTPLPLVEQVWRGETSLPWAAGVVEFVVVRGAGLARTALDAASELRLARYPRARSFRLAADRPARSFRKLCQEHDVPAWLRAQVPVLIADGEPVWVGGIGVASAFACATDEAGIEPRWLRALR